MRYVQRIGAKQSSAGGITYGLRIADYYVNPGLLRRISPTTYRKCGGGFAKTVRRRAHHGQGKPSPPRTARVRGTHPATLVQPPVSDI
ncbi:MAG: hypothetical protein LBM98_09615 [Oscillospiraceae bacterium]|nr:hypothetical protein [Oscillospiraceae bacterium]